MEDTDETKAIILITCKTTTVYFQVEYFVLYWRRRPINFFCKSERNK
jgi:hypothetical protein